MLAEIKSKIWFKVLTATGESIQKEYIEWKLPKGCRPGEWIESCSPGGTWLVTNPKGIFMQDRSVFRAEYQGEPLIEGVGLVFVERLRLITEATNLDLKRFGIHRAFAQKF